MRAGERDELIRIEIRSDLTDGFGAEQESWTKLADVWAKIRDLQKGPRSEDFLDDQFIAKDVKTFEVPYIGGVRANPVDPTHRISWEERAWDIKLVTEIRRRKGLIITAEARMEPERSEL
jgi:head-tail adaptor